ncbi:MAG: CRISPR-associated helicase Cas3' [Syntrophorhabdales bacterium]|nr:CRISPR-associated helicase Cas3' [Syntrophorhabdales bacterium]
MKTEYYAHSANKAAKKHPIRDHLTSVAELISSFLFDSPLMDEARLAGLFHDLGKYGDLFQERLMGKEKGIDHWSSGAWMALQDEYRAVAAAMAIEGHHIGLQNFNSNHFRTLNPEKLVSNHPLQLRLSEKDINILKMRFMNDGINPIITNRLFGNEIKGSIGSMLDIRMIFSALVDADFLDTEAHFNGTAGGKQYRQQGPALQAERALKILNDHINQLQLKTQAASEVKKVRSILMNTCHHSAYTRGNLFTLTAPTGSGKTLAMLLFAFSYAAVHRHKRVIMVLPYLSIIEQTASVYREIFEPYLGQNYVLEHHSLAGVGVEKNKSDSDGHMGEIEAAERQRRLLSENWDAPVIITTSVQMLESLFSNRPSACRKLHRLRNAVIVFDEVQTLPVNLVLPTLAALSHLAHNHNSIVMFATATQPAFEHLHKHIRSYSMHGWQPKEIVQDSQGLFKIMKRVDFLWDRPDKRTKWQELAIRLNSHTQVLCILNIKRHARLLWDKVGDDAFHLSTNMCPAHRQDVLKYVSSLLKSKNPVKLIATQCIEAGVDIDFPVVYRAYAPLDAIIQAAGRCNREGRLDGFGKVFVFQPFIEDNETEYPDGAYRQAAQITKALVERYGCEDMRLDDPGFIAGYYRELYDISRPETMEKTNKINEYIKAGSFPDIAKEYRLIKQDAINIVVPYGERISEFELLLDEANKIGLTAEWIKRARPLTVSVYRPKYNDIIWESLVPVKIAVRKDRENNEWFIYIKKEDYHPMLGLIPSDSPNIWIA